MLYSSSPSTFLNNSATAAGSVEIGKIISETRSALKGAGQVYYKNSELSITRSRPAPFLNNTKMVLDGSLS